MKLTGSYVNTNGIKNQTKALYRPNLHVSKSGLQVHRPKARVIRTKLTNSWIDLSVHRIKPRVIKTKLTNS